MTLYVLSLRTLVMSVVRVHKSVVIKFPTITTMLISSGKLRKYRRKVKRRISENSMFLVSYINQTDQMCIRDRTSSKLSASTCKFSYLDQVIELRQQ